MKFWGKTSLGPRVPKESLLKKFVWDCRYQKREIETVPTKQNRNVFWQQLENNQEKVKQVGVYQLTEKAQWLLTLHLQTTSVRSDHKAVGWKQKLRLKVMVVKVLIIADHHHAEGVDRGKHMKGTVQRMKPGKIPWTQRGCITIQRECRLDQVNVIHQLRAVMK